MAMTEGLPERFEIVQGGLIRKFRSTVYRDANGEWRMQTVTEYPIIGQVTLSQHAVDESDVRHIYEEYEVTDEG